MIDKSLLQFDVLTQPKKDLFKVIQSNAKFKTISDVLKVRVGINNFYNFSIAIRSSIAFRDIILNSQFISGWARSSQVLNKTDSKFANYRFLSKTEEETKNWISDMEKFEAEGFSMDNMRSLIYLDSITDYAISVDILHLLYIAILLDSIYSSLDESHNDLKDEIGYFLYKISDLLLNDYDVSYGDFDMLQYAIKDFPVINTEKHIALKDITLEAVYDVNATYSVVGQLFRHRTLVKKYTEDNYMAEVELSKKMTKDYDYNQINLHPLIASYVKSYTENAKSFYGLCQGSIVPIQISGTTGAIHTALCQRTCFINDSPQFKDAFNDFQKIHPELPLLPPCKFNGKNCYVGYVNESRRRGEEKTQIICPIYAKGHDYVEDFESSKNASKTQWYKDNLPMWENVCK